MRDVQVFGGLDALARALDKATPSCTTFAVEDDGIRITHAATDTCSEDAYTHLLTPEEAAVHLAISMLDHLTVDALIIEHPTPKKKGMQA